MHSALLPSPIGPLYVEIQDGKLTRLDGGGHRFHAGAGADEGRFAAVTAQLAEYFAGERTSFDLPLTMHGTPFELRVWEALRTIPHGETRSYGELASQIGAPGSARAVGRANGRNQISIIVPCHRVIGADGTLTGYAGGLQAKRALLEHERGVAAPA
jgi:methylated-DNA-[protein]-cysteine S-methyltransferase